MKLLTFIIFAIGFSFIGFSQNSDGDERATLKKLRKDKEICEAYAQKAIVEMKNKGVLLVRLNFKQKQIDYLRKNGNHDYAEKLIEKCKLDNEFIAQAFQENFDFCPVVFFKMNDSRKLIEGKIDSMGFFNHSLEKIDFSIDSSRIFIAEFGRIKQDTVQYLSGYSQEPGDSTQRSHYYGGTKNSRSALVIMNEKFQQIREPFPYFAPYSALASRKQKYRNGVLKLNGKLNKFLKQQ